MKYSPGSDVTVDRGWAGGVGVGGGVTAGMDCDSGVRGHWVRSSKNVRRGGMVHERRRGYLETGQLLKAELRPTADCSGAKSRTV